MTAAESRDLAAEYAAPDAALVDRALARIGNPQHRRVFYAKLENPKWVAPLTKKKAFSDPPTVTVDDQGAPRFTGWPQGEYLAKVAPLVPRDVITALRPSLGSENPVVQRVVVEAASRMPAAEAAELVSAICGYVKQPYPALLDPTKLVTVVRRLAEGGKTKKAKELADALYRPRPSAEPASDQDVSGALDSYWYAQTLPDVTSALAGESTMLPSAVNWLEKWARPAMSTPYARVMRSMWRHSIDSNEGMRPTDPIGHALVDAVRDLSRARISAGCPLSEVVEQVERGAASIFLRLSLDAIAYALSSASDARDAALTEGAAPGTHSAIVEIAYERLITPVLLEGEYRPEYTLLARSILPFLSGEQTGRWQHLIADPPHLTAERVGRMLGGPVGDATGVAADEVARYVARWQRDLLAAIGRAALPARLQAWLDELIAAHGDPPEASNLQFWGGFVGPTSPLDDAEVADRSPRDLAAYLHSWEPSRDTGVGLGFPPSAEGLARSVTRAVAANPEQYALRADLFVGLRSVYVSAVIEGFQQAIDQKHGFAWEPVLALAAHATGQPDEARNTGASHDESWRYAQQQAARLIQAGLDADQATAIPPALYAASWAVVGPVTRSAYPTAEDEQEYGPPSTDALTLSLNTSRPVALRTAIRLLLALSRSSADSGLAESAATAQEVTQDILAALDEHAGPDSDARLAVAAVFGEGLGTLLSAARVWTSARLDRILGQPGRSEVTEADTAWFDTAWAVMLSGYRPSRGLFEPLKPWFMQRIRELRTEQPDVVSAFSMRSPRQALADHVLMLSVTGQLDDGLQDEALTDLFSHGDGVLLRNALGQLGWQLSHAQGEIPETVLDRFRALWEWREQQIAQGHAERQELLDFYWWVSSGRLDADWWLPRLAIVVSDPEFTTHEMLGEPLARAAVERPGQVLEIYAALRASGQILQSYDLIKHAPAILKRALASGQPDIERRAYELAEQLGKEGYADLMDQIRALPE
jgi:hypothetical protein